MSRTPDYFQARGSWSIIQWRVYSWAEIDYASRSNREEWIGDTGYRTLQLPGREGFLDEEVASIRIRLWSTLREIWIKLNDRVSVPAGTNAALFLLRLYAPCVHTYTHTYMQQKGSGTGRARGCKSRRADPSARLSYVNSSSRGDIVGLRTCESEIHG